MSQRHAAPAASVNKHTHWNKHEGPKNKAPLRHSDLFCCLVFLSKPVIKSQNPNWWRNGRRQPKKQKLKKEKKKDLRQGRKGGGQM